MYCSLLKKDFFGDCRESLALVCVVVGLCGLPLPRPFCSRVVVPESLGGGCGWRRDGVFRASSPGDSLGSCGMYGPLWRCRRASAATRICSGNVRRVVDGPRAQAAYSFFAIGVDIRKLSSSWSYRKSSCSARIFRFMSWCMLAGKDWA